MRYRLWVDPAAAAIWSQRASYCVWGPIVSYLWISQYAISVYNFGRTQQKYYPNNHTYYPLPPEGYRLVALWEGTPSDTDAIESGVLADWLEDHREYLLTGATGPTDPAQRLDELISYLRSRLVTV